MKTPQIGPPARPKRRKKRSAFKRFVEFKGIRRLSPAQYRDHVRDWYSGPAGAVLALSSLISLHEPLIGRILRRRKFDVTAHRTILDVGSGAGQILGHLLRQTHPDTRLVAFDLSPRMVRRARQRLKSERPLYVAGDLMHLPFSDNSFDCATCGWVIEHLPDLKAGLNEIGRVLRPGGSVLILATEDTISGAFTSRTWKCRTYNRAELKHACEEAGLPWKSQLWFTPVHRFFKLGGILFEAVKSDSEPSDQSPS
jgi:SAM-dependent methyltransferase